MISHQWKLVTQMQMKEDMIQRFAEILPPGPGTHPGIMWAGWQELFLSNAFSAPSCLIQNDLHESVQNYCLQ